MASWVKSAARSSPPSQQRGAKSLGGELDPPTFEAQKVGAWRVSTQQKPQTLLTSFTSTLLGTELTLEPCPEIGHTAGSSRLTVCKNIPAHASHSLPKA